MRHIVTLFVLVALTACAGNAPKTLKEQLIGKWQLKETISTAGNHAPVTDPIISEFFPDGSYTASLTRQNGLENVTKGLYTVQEPDQLTIEIVESTFPNVSPSTASVRVEAARDTLTLHNENGSAAVYTRANP